MKEVLAPKYPERRERGRFDFMNFCLTYFHDGSRIFNKDRNIFWEPNELHLDVCSTLQAMILTVGQVIVKKALAAPRGIGKTTLVLLAIIWAMLYRHRFFIIVICKNGTNAGSRLETIMAWLQNNNKISDDFPEITNWIESFEGDSRRASSKGGKFSSEFIKLNNCVIVKGFGADASIPGQQEEGQRPDLVLIDDPEDTHTVKSASMTRTIWDNLQHEVLYLHGAGQRASYICLCTVRKLKCVADRLTDEKQEPSWHGSRWKAMPHPPDREDLWERFVDLCRKVYELEENETLDEYLDNKDETYASSEEVIKALNYDPKDFLDDKIFEKGKQAALRFYVANKNEMDRGKVMLDEMRKPVHEFYMDIAGSEDGEEVAYCQLQNDPQSDPNISEIQLDIEQLQFRKISLGKSQLPPWASYIFMSVDLGLYQFWWEINAWDYKLETSHVMEVGVINTNIDKGGRYKLEDNTMVLQSMVKDSIIETLERLHRQHAARTWQKDGDDLSIKHFFTDVGGTASGIDWYEKVLNHCAKYRGRWIPMKGSRWDRSIRERARGENWICEMRGNPYRRVDANADHYKRESVRALQDIPVDQVGARSFYRNIPDAYLKQLTAEKFNDEFLPDKPSDKSEKTGWIRVSRMNHYFDTQWMQRAGADIIRKVRPKIEESKEKEPNLKSKPADASKPRKQNDERRKRF